ncbi:MAG: aminotransferase class I/II-fold pyridoxal phosphate-dependent enzyme [Fibrobacterales bacterium]
MQIHGSIPYTEVQALNINPEDIIDFSVSINPFDAPIHSMVDTIGTSLKEYPDNSGVAIKTALSKHLGHPYEHIVLCAGTTELIFNFPKIWKTSAIVEPTYGDYREAYVRNTLDPLSLTIETLISSEPEQLRNLLVDTECLCLCNPNNPTGDYLSPLQIATIATSIFPTMLIVDEAYQELGVDCLSASDLIPTHKNIILLKSLTKPFGVAGLRVGYALTHPNNKKKLERELLPWAIPTIAQRIIPEILSKLKTVSQQWDETRLLRASLISKLLDLHFTIQSSQAPFFLCNVGDSEACRVWCLKNYSIALRSCSSFGLPEWIRIFPLIHDKNITLIHALQEWRTYYALHNSSNHNSNTSSNKSSDTKACI